MRTAASLVSSQNVGANDDPSFCASSGGRRCRPWEANGFPYRLPIKFGNVSMRIGAKAISERLLTGHFRIERVSIASGDNLMKNLPDYVAIRFGCCAYFHRFKSKALFSCSCS